MNLQNQNISNLLSEISHELKNKLGIISSIIKDYDSGYHIPPDEIKDSIQVLSYLIELSNILDLSNLNKSTSVIIHEIICKYLNVKYRNQESTDFFILEIDSKLYNEELKLDSNVNKDILKFFNQPKNSFDKICGQLIRLINNEELSLHIKLIRKNDLQTIAEEVI